MKPRYIDWGEIFARDAPFNLIIAKRELGKSFGAREQTLRDYRDHSERCVAVVRYMDDVTLAIQDFYGDVAEKTSDKKLRKWLATKEFRRQGSSILIRDKPQKGNKEKPQWDEIMRMIPLSKATRYKMATMTRLRRVLFDEALIDKQIDSYTRYLPNEYRLLQNLIGTLQRYSAKDANGQPRLRVYLMGNAVDLINPYFAALGINQRPAFGQRWIKNKTWYFFYPDPNDYEIKRPTEGIAERMGDSASDYGNEFEAGAAHFVDKKPSSAVFNFGVVYQGMTFGIWDDMANGYCYVTSKIPSDPNAVVYALSAEDNRPNYIVAKSANKTLRALSDLYCYGVVKFENAATRERFNDVLSLFGVR